MLGRAGLLYAKGIAACSGAPKGDCSRQGIACNAAMADSPLPTPMLHWACHRVRARQQRAWPKREDNVRTSRKGRRCVERPQCLSQAAQWNGMRARGPRRDPQRDMPAAGCSGWRGVRAWASHVAAVRRCRLIAANAASHLPNAKAECRCRKQGADTVPVSPRAAASSALPPCGLQGTGWDRTLNNKKEWLLLRGQPTSSARAPALQKQTQGMRGWDDGLSPSRARAKYTA